MTTIVWPNRVEVCDRPGETHPESTPDTGDDAPSTPQGPLRCLECRTELSDNDRTQPVCPYCGVA